LRDGSAHLVGIAAKIGARTLRVPREWPIPGVMKLAGCVAVGLLASTSVAFAQAQIVPTDGIKGAEKTDLEGWSPVLGVTGTISLTSNRSVVGQVDGFSTLFGLGVTGGADYVNGRHIMRSTLSINESFARTPVVDEFVKTNDVVKLEGLYNYFLTQELGLYGRPASRRPRSPPTTCAASRRRGSRRTRTIPRCPSRSSRWRSASGCRRRSRRSRSTRRSVASRIRSARRSSACRSASAPVAGTRSPTTC
jgi:hypothetical protein